MPPRPRTAPARAAPRRGARVSGPAPAPRARCTPSSRAAAVTACAARGPPSPRPTLTSRPAAADCAAMAAAQRLVGRLAAPTEPRSGSLPLPRGWRPACLRRPPELPTLGDNCLGQLSSMKDSESEQGHRRLVLATRSDTRMSLDGVGREASSRRTSRLVRGGRGPAVYVSAKPLTARPAQRARVRRGRARPARGGVGCSPDSLSCPTPPARLTWSCLGAGLRLGPSTRRVSSLCSWVEQ